MDLSALAKFGAKMIFNKTSKHVSLQDYKHIEKQACKQTNKLLSMEA